MVKKSLGLREQVLLAAAACSGGDPRATFSAEDLLLEAWKRNPAAWGLRNHETEHPDSERMYLELDRASVKGGMVGMGLFEKVQRRVYRLTPAGFARIAMVSRERGGEDVGGKASRAVADAVTAVLGHETFRGWLRDPSFPKRFRDAGGFWGIAPGTPPSVARERVARVDLTLRAALDLLDEKGIDEIAKQRGQRLYDRQDIDRCLEFQAVLKGRFATELRMLYGESAESKVGS